MKNNIIPYGKQSISDADIKAVKKVLGSDFLTTGPKVEEFEHLLCTLTGANYAVSCSNGTAALHLACLSLGIKKGDLGITSAITFLASANCIEFCGGRTDFVDIDTETLCVSVEQLEDYCKNKEVPKVVIPVDFTGVPANLPEIWKLSQKYGFKVIEDAAHAIGSTYNYNELTYQCGSCEHSDLSVLSFHPVKTITTGEGGAVLTNDKNLANRLRMFLNHGMTKDVKSLTRNDGPWYYEMHELGYNYRITDIQCALGTSQLEKLPVFKKRRQEIVKKYNEVFSDKDKVVLPPWQDETSPSFHLYVLQFSEGIERRKIIYDELRKHNIFTQVHYIPVYWQPYYKNKYSFKEGKCPNAEKYYSRCLSLPLYPDIDDNDVDYVIDLITKHI